MASLGREPLPTRRFLGGGVFSSGRFFSCDGGVLCFSKLIENFQILPKGPGKVPGASWTPFSLIFYISIFKFYFSIF